jgi:hypothetical protein
MATSQRISVRPLLGALAAVASTAILAGCGGSAAQVNPQSLTGVNAAPSSHSSGVQPDACRSNGGVRATPCRVELTASNPGPVSVTLRTPHGAKGSVVEHDNCGTSGVATVAQGSGNTWIVTAGSTAGSCKARFNYFNNAQKVGWARIEIQNTI